MLKVNLEKYWVWVFFRATYFIYLFNLFIYVEQRFTEIRDKACHHTERSVSLFIFQYQNHTGLFFARFMLVSGENQSLVDSKITMEHYRRAYRCGPY